MKLSADKGIKMTSMPTYQPHWIREDFIDFIGDFLIHSPSNLGNQKS